MMPELLFEHRALRVDIDSRLALLELSTAKTTRRALRDFSTVER